MSKPDKHAILRFGRRFLRLSQQSQHHRAESLSGVISGRAADVTRTLPYPPPWQDTATLAAHISASPATVENWVAAGILPPPRKRGGKLMWLWAEVDDWLRNGRQDALASEATGIRDAVKKEREADLAARY